MSINWCRTMGTKNIFIVIVILLGFLPLKVHAADTQAQLSFYRVVDDKQIYDKNPSRYEVVKYGKYDTYIEKQPAYKIPQTAIQSVIIRITKVYPEASKKEED